MFNQRFTLVVAVLLVLFAVTAEPVPAAQDCGRDCFDCGFYRWEGRNFSLDGVYNMSCNEFSLGCDWCPLPFSVSDDAADPEGILHIVGTASSTALSQVVEQYGSRLVIHTTRNLLAVKSPCEPQALAAVVFLAPERTEALERLGVEKLDKFLAKLASEK